MPSKSAPSSTPLSKSTSKKPRFRTIKKQHKSANTPNVRTHTLSAIAREIFLVRRLKALLVDMFMIYTPILYCAYWILGGAQDFRDSQLAIFVCFVSYASICALFIAKSGQTPGLRYVCLQLVDTSYTPESTQSPHRQVGFMRAFVRVFVWAFTCAIVVGFVAPFISQSRQCLHDRWLKTKLIDRDTPMPNAPKAQP